VVFLVGFILLLAVATLGSIGRARAVVTSALVDPGHGGVDPGAVHAGVRESDLVLVVARAIQAAGSPAGVAVELTRTDDRTLSLAARRVHAGRSARLVSVHTNAALNREARGGEVWVNTPGEPLGRAIEEQWRAAPPGGIPWRRVWRASSWRDWTGRGPLWIENVSKPAVLLEIGFLSNPADRAAMIQPAVQAQVAGIIIRALLAVPA